MKTEAFDEKDDLRELEITVRITGANFATAERMQAFKHIMVKLVEFTTVTQPRDYYVLGPSPIGPVAGPLGGTGMGLSESRINKRDDFTYTPEFWKVQMTLPDGGGTTDNLSVQVEARWLTPPSSIGCAFFSGMGGLLFGILIDQLSGANVALNTVTDSIRFARGDTCSS